VREANYRLDKRMAFLTGASNTNNPLWPLDFIIQAVPQSLEDEQIKPAEGWEPWHFPTIESQIRTVVAAGIASDASAKSVFEQMRAFTILQRLFRLALAGDLGMSFPLQELERLQLATAPFVKAERNERWNLNQPLSSLLVKEYAGIKDNVQDLASSNNSPAACRAAAKQALANAGSEDWPKGDGLWTQVSDVEKGCNQYSGFSALGGRLEWLRSNDLIDEAIHIVHRDRGSNATFACHPL